MSGKSTEEVFTDIFENNKWKGEVPSGPGSSLAVTAILRQWLTSLFEEMNIQTLCDAPCGDGTWIFEITHRLEFYFGVDVVKKLVETHARRDLPRNHFFMTGDLIETILPKVDAIFCRDCLVHLTLEQAVAAVANLKRSGSTYLITTTFPTRTENIPARTGSWRPLNLEIPPFSFPKPIEIIRERATDPDDRNNDKSMGVWRLSDL